MPIFPRQRRPEAPLLDYCRPRCLLATGERQQGLPPVRPPQRQRASCGLSQSLPPLPVRRKPGTCLLPSIYTPKAQLPRSPPVSANRMHASGHCTTCRMCSNGVSSRSSLRAAALFAPATPRQRTVGHMADQSLLTASAIIRPLPQHPPHRHALGDPVLDAEALIRALYPWGGFLQPLPNSPQSPQHPVSEHRYTLPAEA